MDFDFGDIDRMEDLRIKRETAYNCKVRPSQEWIKKNCVYYDEEKGFRYKKFRPIEIFFPKQNKCTMLNGQ